MAKFSPQLTRSAPPKGTPAQRHWRVVLYNNHYHRLVDVLGWLQNATGCDQTFAGEICHVCQTEGRSVCYLGNREDCHRVATALRFKGLQVEVDDF